jgi:hypothetical protein
MNEDIDIEKLREAFTAHEHLVPNSNEVLARAGKLARRYRRRRRAAQAAGASVLGVGVVAGSVVLPGRHWNTNSGQGGVSTLAGTSSGPLSLVLPTPTPTPTKTYTQQQELSAYFGAGYDYNNAVALASLWHETDIDKVKADAGLKLLQGQTLPVPPNGTPETPQEKAIDAFLNAGYTYDDAVTLGQMWNETDVVQIKAEAGQKLLDGQTLPIAPSVADSPNPSTAPSSEINPAQARALAAYVQAGYNYDDAVALGKLWNKTDLLQIKTEAGQQLLDGQQLPIAP